jgi:hypothetical protein
MASFFYMLRHSPNGKEGEFVMTKLDEDLEFENAYTLTKLRCSCPQNQKHPEMLCKHIKLIGLFERTGNIESGRMWNSANGMWRDPIVGTDELDNLFMDDTPTIGETKEDRLINVVAPALRQESTIKPIAQPATEFRQATTKPIRRR